MMSIVRCNGQKVFQLCKIVVIIGKRTPQFAPCCCQRDPSKNRYISRPRRVPPAFAGARRRVRAASRPHPTRVCGRPQTRLPAGTISFCCLRASGRRKHITSEFFGNIQPALSLSQFPRVHTVQIDKLQEKLRTKLSQYTRNRIISPRESNNSIVNIFRILPL